MYHLSDLSAGLLNVLPSQVPHVGDDPAHALLCIPASITQCINAPIAQEMDNHLRNLPFACSFAQQPSQSKEYIYVRCIEHRQLLAGDASQHSLMAYTTRAEAFFTLHWQTGMAESSLCGLSNGHLALLAAVSHIPAHHSH